MSSADLFRGLLICWRCCCCGSRLLQLLPMGQCLVIRNLQSDMGRTQEQTQKIWVLDGQMVKTWGRRLAQYYLDLLKGLEKIIIISGLQPTNGFQPILCRTLSAIFFTPCGESPVKRFKTSQFFELFAFQRKVVTEKNPLVVVNSTSNPRRRRRRR